MDWNDVLQIELQRSLALEIAFGVALERLEAKAHDASVRTRIRDLARVASHHAERLERVCVLMKYPFDDRPSRLIEGWRADVEELVEDQSPCPPLDALILALLQKMVRAKYACYEMSLIIALGLGQIQIIEPLKTCIDESHDDAEETAKLVEFIVSTTQLEWPTSLRFL